MGDMQSPRLKRLASYLSAIVDCFKPAVTPMPRRAITIGFWEVIMENGRRQRQVTDSEGASTGLRRFSRMLKAASLQFGKRCQVRDVQTLVAVAEALGPWPENVPLRDLERLERVDGRGGPGFGMVVETPGANGRVQLTPKGEDAVQAIVDAFDCIAARVV